MVAPVRGSGHASARAVGYDAILGSTASYREAVENIPQLQSLMSIAILLHRKPHHGIQARHYVSQ